MIIAMVSFITGKKYLILWKIVSKYLHLIFRGKNINLIKLNVLRSFRHTKNSFLFLPLQYVTIRSCRLTEKIYYHLKKARKNRPPFLFFYCFCGAWLFFFVFSPHIANLNFLFRYTHFF